jgi:hypothetical protein
LALQVCVAIAGDPVRAFGVDEVDELLGGAAGRVHDLPEPAEKAGDDIDIWFARVHDPQEPAKAGRGVYNLCPGPRARVVNNGK